MRKGLLIALLLALLAGGLGQLGSSAQGRTDLQVAQVSRVIDGDTIEVVLPDDTTEKVRYIGIDTPETVHPTEPVGCFGPEASEYNKALVDDKTVWLELDVQERDRYGRLLAYVHLVSDSQAMVNAILLSQGFAQIYTFPPNVKHVDRFLALEREARDAHRGLWGACGPPPPPSCPEPPSGAVVINEIEQNPAGTDSGNEWVELYNTSDQEVCLEGWFIVADYQGVGGREGRINIPDNTLIPSEGFAILVGEGQVIDNVNEVVELRNADAQVVDQTPSVTDTKNDDRCWARVPDGSDTWEFQTCTPNKSNS